MKEAGGKGIEMLYLYKTKKFSGQFLTPASAKQEAGFFYKE
jgi:hypothetical protein